MWASDRRMILFIFGLNIKIIKAQRLNCVPFEFFLCDILVPNGVNTRLIKIRWSKFIVIPIFLSDFLHLLTNLYAKSQCHKRIEKDCKTLLFPKIFVKSFPRCWFYVNYFVRFLQFHCIDNSF